MNQTTQAAPQTAPPATPTSYTIDQLLTRNRRRQYVTKDGRFQLRQAGHTEYFYWHGLARRGGKTIVGNPLSGPGGSFYTTFSDKAGALATLNKICADYASCSDLF